MSLRCDLFCSIVDNFGDIGVCWRLARQLAHEHGWSVTLWVDDLTTFARLAPLDPEQAQQNLDGILVRHWREPLPPFQAGQVVIEGFACALPADMLANMREARPVWLNLEYLSAENWVEDCHGLPSVNPATGLTQHFWFPGFTARTGGLLREAGLVAQRDAFQASAALQAEFWARLGLADAPDFDRRLSLFAYENAATAGLLTALAADGQTSLLVVPEGRALADVSRWAGRAGLVAGDRVQHGALTIAVIPLLSHADYDRLLWACELNAVRGEDSFVRAQWAARPWLWHIYPQEEDTHLIKLAAFNQQVARHSPGMPGLWTEAQEAWNQGDARPELWAALLADLAVITPPSQAWSRYLTSQPGLAQGLVHFCRSRVE